MPILISKYCMPFGPCMAKAKPRAPLVSGGDGHEALKLVLPVTYGIWYARRVACMVEACNETMRECGGQDLCTSRETGED